MVRFKVTVRLTNEGREIDTADTVFISEIMKDFGMIFQRKEKDDLKKNVSDAEGNINGDDAEDDGSILSLSKFNYIEFGRFIMKSDDLVLMNQFGYVGKNDDDLVRFVGDEIILEPKEDEVVVFKSFFRAGFRFLLYEMIVKVLKRFEIYFYYLMLNAIVRFSVYI